MQYLLKHPEIKTNIAAMMRQREKAHMREFLSTMEKAGYIEHGSTGRGTYCTLRPELHHRLSVTGHPERDRRINWEAAKTRVLSILMDRFKRGEPGLSNQDIRQITHFDRNQVFRLMKQLRLENPNIQAPGKGKHARYTYEDK